MQRNLPLTTKHILSDYLSYYRKEYNELSKHESGITLKKFNEDYYADLKRWPDYAIKNIAKQRAIKKFNLPEKHNFEITTQCLFKCEFCVLHSGALSSKRQKKHMSLNDFETIIEHMKDYVTHIEFTGGEPLLNSNLFEMINICNSNHIKTTLATNAKLLNDKNINKLIKHPPSILLIAYEGGNDLSYNLQRKGGNFNSLRNNIIALINQKKNKYKNYPRIFLQTVVSKITLNSLDKFWEDAQHLNVDAACIKPIFIWPDGSNSYQKMMIDNYLVLDHALSYYKTGSDGSISTTCVDNYCPNIKSVHIGTGGEVIPCWYNLLTSPSMGNVTSSHFFDIWFSDNYIKFRNFMTEHKAYNHKCKFCIGIYKPELFTTKYFK
jgi:radical SAM protein with 4Fe4S-binding SPASM domain